MCKQIADATVLTVWLQSCVHPRVEAEWILQYVQVPLDFGLLELRSNDAKLALGCLKHRLISARKIKTSYCVHKISKRKWAIPDGIGFSVENTANKCAPRDSLAISWRLWEWSQNLLLCEFCSSSLKKGCPEHFALFHLHPSLPCLDQVWWSELVVQPQQFLL